MAERTGTTALDGLLEPRALARRSASPVSGLVTVPLPPAGLPVHSLAAAFEAIVGTLPLDPQGRAAMDAIRQALELDAVPSLEALDGLLLTKLAFGSGQTSSFFIAFSWPEADWELLHGFRVGAPELSLAVTAGAWELDVGGTVGFGPLDFDCEVVLPEVELSADLAHSAKLGDVLGELHLDGSSLDELELTRASLHIAVPDRQVSFGLAVAGDWHPFGQGRGPALRSLEFDIAWSKADGDLSAEFAAELALGPVIFDAWVEYQSPGWELGATLRAADPGELSIQNLVDAALEAFGVDLEVDVPFDAQLNSAGVSLSTASGAFSAHCEVEVEGATIDLELSLVRDAAGARALTVSGKVTAGGIELDLIYSDGSFLAVFWDKEGHSLDLSQLMEELIGLMGADQVPDLPPVELSVREILAVGLKPESPADPGTGSGSTPKPKRRMLLFVDLDVGFNVGALPLIGDVFGSDFELEVRFAPRYASQALTVDDVGAINDLLPPDVSPLPAGPIAAGAGFDAQVSLGGMSFGLPIGAGMDNDSGKMAPAGQAGVVDPTTPPKDGRSWVQLDKTIGPLSLERLGLGMKDGEVELVLDGGIALGPVAAAALGLGVSYDLDSHHLTPQLDGLAVAFSAGAVSIAGGFLRIRSTDPDAGDTYAGLIRVVASEFQLSALGLYQEVHGGPTFFIYGYAGFSVGLRPIITLDGIALGFGYGRKLIAVPVDKIHDFPLVKEAVGEPKPPPGAGGENAALAVLDELRDLQGYLPPARGGIVFALGVKVGLLEALIDGFVLATVSFSTESIDDLLIQIFGAATAALPPKTPAGPFVARLELDIVARIRPAQGELLIGLNIGKGSYVLDPHAALTGGIAFGVWMAGDHAGDFVLTAGGYSPTYKKPAHYPSVPRLGLTWKVSDALLVKGELYGAVTPSTFMAGGRIEANFRAGKVHAWFKLWMDLAIQFKPFHYDFRVGVEIGAAYGSLGISAHADLHIWGPDFSGTAHISVRVVLFKVSFDVRFGAAAAAPPPLGWQEFREAFLPPADRLCVPSAAAGVLDTLEGERAEGLPVGTDGKHWVVSPDGAELAITGTLPFVDGEPLSIKPMSGAEKTSRLTASEPVVTLSHNGAAANDLGEFFELETTEKRFPTALWNRAGNTGETVSLAGKLRLRARAPEPGTEAHVPRANLRFTRYALQPEAAIPAVAPPAAAPRASTTPAAIGAVLRDAGVGERRRTVLAGLGMDTRDHGIRDHWERVGLSVGAGGAAMSFDDVVFADFHETQLLAGEYELRVRQSATGTDHAGDAFSEELVDAHLRFSVMGPRYELPAEAIHLTYPPKGTIGAYAGVLPHVILKRDTLPWLRSANRDPGHQHREPWLALLVFTANEWSEVVVDGGTTDAQGISVKELQASADAGQVQLTLGAAESQQHGEDRLRVIDVPAHLVGVCPRSTEVRMLCHVRRSDGEARAIVVAPRALLPGSDGEDYTVCLVSVENRFGAGDFASPTSPDDGSGKPVRFVLLHRWSFHSRSERPQLHTALAEVLRAEAAPRGHGGGVDGGEWELQLTRADPGLRLRPSPAEDPAATARRHHGYVPVAHHLRDGSRSAAWYRGPLVPWDVPAPAPDVAPEARHPDELLRFDGELGMFDISYAAAWQLGRLLALGNAEFALRLMRWKRRHRQELHRLRQRFDEDLHVLPLPPDAHAESGADPDEFWLHNESLLAALARLEGIPWRYLVAHDGLLPAGRSPTDPTQREPGGFGAFLVDPRWVETLRDGAFSVGRVVAADIEEDRRARAGHPIVPHTFGFLLRGPMVRAWPDLACEAWVPRQTPAGSSFEEKHASVAPFRIARPGSDVLLALFTLEAAEDVVKPDSVPVAFDLHPPPQTLHFGLDHDGSNWTRKVRDPASGSMVRDPVDTARDLTVTVPFHGGGQGVVDVAGLATTIGQALPGKPTLHPHTLALALLDPPDGVRIHLPPPRGSA